MMLPLGALIVLLIVVPWYAALYHAHGWTYIRSFIVSENLERYTSGYGVHQDRGPWFYIPVVLERLVSVVARADCRRARGVAGARRASNVLMWCWIGVIVGFFSLSAGKQDLYIFPTIAAAVGPIAGCDRARPAASGVAVVDVRDGCARSVPGRGCRRSAVLWLFSTAGRIYALDRRCCRRSLRPDRRGGGAHRVACAAPGAAPRWRSSPR